MSKATPDDLGKLHAILTEAFIERISLGEASEDAEGNVTRKPASPATLSAAVRFLKDNRIEADMASNSRLKDLARSLLDGVDE